MKIEKGKKATGHKKQLLKLKLIQTKIYSKKQYQSLLKVEDTEIRLKKIFHVIYRYHVENKRILFVGAPLNKDAITSLLTDTKHAFIPESFWIKGAISNRSRWLSDFLLRKKKTENQTLQLISQLHDNIHLLVIFNKPKKSPILEESSKAKIPTILLSNNDFNVHDNEADYEVLGDFKSANKKLSNNLFYSILTSILKRGNLEIEARKRWAAKIALEEAAARKEAAEKAAAEKAAAGKAAALKKEAAKKVAAEKAAARKAATPQKWQSQKRFEKKKKRNNDAKNSNNKRDERKILKNKSKALKSAPQTKNKYFDKKS